MTEQAPEELATEGTEIVTGDDSVEQVVATGEPTDTVLDKPAETVSDESNGIPVTEDPGSAPDDVDQGDPDDNASDDQPGDPEPSDEVVSADGDA